MSNQCTLFTCKTTLGIEW